MPFEAINIEDVAGKQVISIPDRLKINDDKVYLKKVGEILYVIPFHDPWRCLMDGAEEFSPDFMEQRDEPEWQHRENLDK